jgi:hypothetical protein
MVVLAIPNNSESVVIKLTFVHNKLEIHFFINQPLWPKYDLMYGLMTVGELRAISLDLK